MFINNSDIDTIEVANSITPTHGYGKGGAGSNETLTITCDPKGTIEISDTVIRNLDHTSLLEFSFILNALTVSTKIRNGQPVKIKYSKEKAVIHDPHLVKRIAERFQLDVENSQSYQLYCVQGFGKQGAVFCLAEKQTAFADCLRQIKELGPQTVFGVFAYPESRHQLAIYNNPKGMISLSEEIGRDLGFPEIIEFGFYENALVVSTGILNSQEVKVNWDDREGKGIIICPDLVYEIMEKYGFPYGDGLIYRMHMAADMEFGEELYEFFLLTSIFFEDDKEQAM